MTFIVDELITYFQAVYSMRFKFFYAIFSILLVSPLSKYNNSINKFVDTGIKYQKMYPNITKVYIQMT